MCITAVTVRAVAPTSFPLPNPSTELFSKATSHEVQHAAPLACLADTARNTFARKARTQQASPLQSPRRGCLVGIPHREAAVPTAQ